MNQSDISTVQVLDTYFYIVSRLALPSENTHIPVGLLCISSDSSVQGLYIDNWPSLPSLRFRISMWNYFTTIAWVGTTDTCHIVTLTRTCQTQVRLCVEYNYLVPWQQLWAGLRYRDNLNSWQLEACCCRMRAGGCRMWAACPWPAPPPPAPSTSPSRASSSPAPQVEL